MKPFYIVWAIALVLIAAACLFLASAGPGYAAGPTTWTETWANRDQWRNIDTPCFTIESGTLRGVCQSASFQTLKKWSPNADIKVSWSMSGKQAAGSSTNEYFVGMTLWQREDSPRNSNYQEVALVRHVPPFTANSHNRIGALTSPQSGTWNVGAYQLWDPTGLNAIIPGTMYAFRLDWLKAQNRSNIYWQAPTGQKMTYLTRNPFLTTLPVYVRLLVVCVGEGVGDNGCKADGRFGPITVTGVPM